MHRAGLHAKIRLAWRPCNQTTSGVAKEAETLLLQDFQPQPPSIAGPVTSPISAPPPTEATYPFRWVCSAAASLVGRSAALWTLALPTFFALEFACQPYRPY
jgi:hypothetical protein